MLKKLLAERGITLTEDLSRAVVQDIAFNNIGFNKHTSLEELLTIAERCNGALGRCI